MADNKNNKVIHKRSEQKGVVPTGTTLEFGELAVNYNSSEPFLSVRTTTGNTNSTTYAKFIDETAIDNKLSKKSDTGHTHSSYVNQNAFSNVKVGTTTISADTTTDTLTLAAGDNVTITPDDSNDTVTIGVTGLSKDGHTHDDRYYTESEVDNKIKDVSDGLANRYGFGNVKVGDVTVAADANVDTLTLVAGTNVQITPDDTKDQLTISAEHNHDSVYSKTGHTHSVTLSGDVTGSANIDGTITTTVANDSHTHGTSTITGTISDDSGITSSATGLVQGKALTTIKSNADYGKTAHGWGNHATAGYYKAQDATTSTKGIVQLSDSVTSSASTKAATEKAVKDAYDLAKSKWKYDEATIKAVKVSNATYADSAGTAVDQTARDAASTAQSTADSKWKAQDATTSAQGIVELVTGDMNGKDHADGEAPSLNHTHSQYQPKGDYSVEGHKHTITLSGDVTGSGDITGTITTTVANDSHTHKSSNISDSISASSAITSGATGLTQGKAVYAYAATKSHSHGSVKLEGDVTGSADFGNGGATITTTVANDSHTHKSSNISDSISASSAITSSATGLVQGKAVYDYAATKGHDHDDIYSKTGHTHSQYLGSGATAADSSKLGGVDAVNYLQKSGGTITGNLNVDGELSFDGETIFKYLDYEDRTMFGFGSTEYDMYISAPRVWMGDLIMYNLENNNVRINGSLAIMDSVIQIDEDDNEVKLDLKNVATQSWVTNTALADNATQTWVTNTALADNATKTWVTNTALADNATKTWVTTQNYITSAATVANANKAADSDKLGNVPAANYLQKSGSTIEGDLEVNGYTTLDGEVSFENDYLLYYYGGDEVEYKEFNFSTVDTYGNKAGASNNPSKLYLIGAQSQVSSAYTYSNASVYMQAGKLYAADCLITGDLEVNENVTFHSNVYFGDSSLYYNDEDDYVLFDFQKVNDYGRKAGASNSTSKLYLIGAGSQGSSVTTYSNASVYMQAGKLYVGDAEVATMTGINNAVSALTSGMAGFDGRLTTIENAGYITSAATVAAAQKFVNNPITITDLNAAENIHGYYNGNSANRPEYAGTVVGFKNTYTMLQLASGYKTNHDMFYRTWHSTEGWSGWKTIIDNENWSKYITVSGGGTTDGNNYLTGVSGSGNGTVTFTRSGLDNLTWNASHTHTEYLGSGATAANASKLGNVAASGYLRTTGGTITSALTVKGVLTVNNDIVISGGTVSGATGYYQTSDERLKTFGDDIDVDFDKLKSIPKKYFTWNDEENKELQIGTSAQKVKELYPELIGYDVETDKYSVDYAKLSVVALKAVDKLHEENEMLKSMLAKMDERLSKLENNN